MHPQFKQAFQTEEHQPIFWQGDQRGALLLHGFPGTPAEMRSVALLLHQHGWTVHAPLLPGFGTDIDTLPERTYADWLNAATSAFHELEKHCSSVTIIGLSMGGALAMRMAPMVRADRLVLLAPFWQIEHVLWRALPVLRHVIPTFKPFKLFKPDFNDPDVRASIQKFIPDADLNAPDVQQGIVEFAIPVRMIDQVRLAGKYGSEAAPAITIPTVIIQGTADELVTPEMTRRLITRLQVPYTYLEVEAEHDLTNPAKPAWSFIASTLTEHLQLSTAEHGAIHD